MEAGEIIARHRHEVMHEVMVVAGAAEIEIWSYKRPRQIRTLTPESGSTELLAFADHEVRAIEDETIVISAISATAAEIEGANAVVSAKLHNLAIIHSA
jgi:hypothetical protein